MAGELWLKRLVSSEMTSRTLPRGQTAANLIACKTDEQHFQDNESAMSMLLNHPDVDGVYETQVPLVVRALLKLGNKCNPDGRSGASLSRGLDQGFVLDQLARATVSLNRRRYLDGGRNLKYAYIYHSNMDGRHIVCLILPHAEARLYIVDKGRNRELPNMEKYYTEARAAYQARQALDKSAASTSLFKHPDALKIEATYHAEAEPVYRAISKELLGLQSRRQGATMLAICSAKSRAFYENRIPAIQYYPVVLIPSSKVDNTYPTRLLWQGPAAKRMIQHYLRLPAWLKDRLALAHHADIPMYAPKKVQWA